MAGVSDDNGHMGDSKYKGEGNQQRMPQGDAAEQAQAGVRCTQLWDEGDGLPYFSSISLVWA